MVCFDHSLAHNAAQPCKGWARPFVWAVGRWVAAKRLPKIAPYAINMPMSQDRLIQLKNKETGEVYWSRKNKKKVEKKIELRKYSKTLRKHITFKEAKK